MGRPSTPLLARLEARFNRTAGCWIWTGKVDNTGYGSFGMRDNGKSRTRSAHKIVYEVFVGKVPDGMQLDHLCRTPLCVNPEHLEVVTPRENTMRSNGLAAVNARKTHCKWGHEFTADNTYVPAKRPNRRYCKICRSEAVKKYKNKSQAYKKA